MGSLAGQNGTEVFTPERCYILQLWGFPEDRSFSVARARVEPGVTTAWHVLRGTQEWYLVVRGRGRLEVGDRTATLVRAGSLVHIPAGTRQRIRCLGHRDLVFYCLCMPAFRPAAYRDLEQSRKHLP